VRALAPCSCAPADSHPAAYAPIPDIRASRSPAPPPPPAFQFGGAREYAFTFAGAPAPGFALAPRGPYLGVPPHYAFEPGPLRLQLPPVRALDAEPPPPPPLAFGHPLDPGLLADLGGGAPEAFEREQQYADEIFGIGGDAPAYEGHDAFGYPASAGDPGPSTVAAAAAAGASWSSSPSTRLRRVRPENDADDADEDEEDDEGGGGGGGSRRRKRAKGDKKKVEIACHFCRRMCLLHYL
jgi:hypothetical protein